MRPPAQTHEAGDVTCPNPYCRERIRGGRAMQGAEVERCDTCNQPYLMRSALGVVDVYGLSEDQWTRYHAAFRRGSMRLSEILRELGVIRTLEKAS